MRNSLLVNRDKLQSVIAGRQLECYSLAIDIEKGLLNS
jgi:hypothetical protein